MTAGDYHFRFPITARNREIRLFSLTRKLVQHANTVALYSGNVSARAMGINPNPRRVTIAVRCINQLARDLYQTNARPVKGKK